MKKEYEVVAAIIESKGKFFCARRGPKGEVGGMWEFPGGKIEAGEKPEDALIREIKEELQTTIRVKKYFHSVHYEYQNFIINLHSYLCEVVDGELVISEHVESKWLSKKELQTLHWAPADEIIINQLL